MKNLKACCIWICPQQGMLPSQASSNSSSLSLTLLNSEKTSQSSGIYRINNVGFPSTPLTNMLSPSTNMKDPILIIAFSPKELLREYGSFVRQLMRGECLFPKLLIGIKNSNKRIRALVKMENESLDLLNTTCLKTDSRKDLNSICRTLTLTLRIKLLLEFFL